MLCFALRCFALLCVALLCFGLLCFAVLACFMCTSLLHTYCRVSHLRVCEKNNKLNNIFKFNKNVQICFMAHRRTKTVPTVRSHKGTMFGLPTKIRSLLMSKKGTTFGRQTKRRSLFGPQKRTDLELPTVIKAKKRKNKFPWAFLEAAFSRLHYG